MEKLAFISTGYFPIPPLSGGAVENLVYSLIIENEKHHRYDFTVYSCDADGIDSAIEKTNYTKYVIIKTPHILEQLDLLIYYFFNNIIKKEKSMSYRYLLKRLWFEYKVAKDLKEKDFNRIIVENTPASFLPFRLYKNEKKYDGKIIYHMHNEVGNTFRCDKIIQNVSLVIGVSEFVNKKFADKFKEFHGNYVVLKNCITEIKKTEKQYNVREKYGIKSNEFLILYAGRLSSEKGVYELIEAVQKATIPNVQLMIVGATYYGSNVVSSYEKKLKDAAQPLKNKITFTGYIPRSEMGEFYREADVAVFPAMWDEPAGLTIIEAMYEGTAVITTDSGGIPEYVDQSCAIVLHRDDRIVENIEQALNELWKLPQKREQYALAGKRNVKKFSKEEYYHSFVEIMEKYK